MLSDVHADLPMLQAALKEMARRGCDRIVCLGDVVDYGVFPEETIALLVAQGIPTIRGNHDRWAITGDALGSGWELSAQGRGFLTTLPSSWRATIDGLRVVAWHARPGSDMHGIPPSASDAELEALLEAENADVLLVGHTHVALARRVPRGLVANPGALLGEPLHDGLPQGGTFGVLELPSMGFTAVNAADGLEVDVPRSAQPQPRGIVVVKPGREK